MKYLLISIAIAASLLANAQPQIKFSETEHDYGSIKEDGGLAETVFEFVNTGDEPLLLKNVVATCGCTTLDWTKNLIAPNEKGTVKIVFNPLGRAGLFSKTVNVFTNAQPGITVLTVKGKVEPRERTVEEIFPQEMGPLRFKSNYLSLGSLYTNETKVSELEIINTSSESAQLGIYRCPGHINIKFEPEVLEPGKEGKILVSYDASKKNAFGYNADRIYLTINGEKQNSYFINIAVSLKEDFSELTEEQLANAPIASFDSKVFDFGTIKQGEKATHNFRLVNKGKTDLIIRDVSTSCGCTAVKSTNLIRPNEIINLEVVFDSKGKHSRQNKTVNIITNDPQNTNIQLRVTGTVLD